MYRNTLRQFIQRIVVASLPMAAGCNECPQVRSQLTSAVTGIAADGGSAVDCDYWCRLSFNDVVKTLGCSVEPFDPTNPSDPYVSLTCDVVQTVCPSSPCPAWGCYDPGPGRRPEGLRPGTITAANPVGAYFARAAHLEAASVQSFLRLAEELTAHGAPSRLVDAAQRAADDERRHAKVTRRLARRYSARTPAVEIDQIASRSLEQIACENAAEGCVFETWGAVVATWQSHAAGDPLVRAAMRRISADETRHAELAFAVAAWADPLLDDKARARVAASRRAAIRALAELVDADAHAALVAQAGIPSRDHARQLMARMWPA